MKLTKEKIDVWTERAKIVIIAACVAFVVWSLSVEEPAHHAITIPAYKAASVPSPNFTPFICISLD